MSLSIDGETGKVDVGNGSVFTVVVSADSIPTGTGYTGVQAWIDYGAGGLAGKGNQQALWADCEPATFVAGASGNAENGGCLTGLIGGFDSFLKGDIFSFDITCDDNSHTIALLALGDAVASTSGAGFDTSGGKVAADNVDVGGSFVADTIDVNCISPTDTPTTPPTATPPGLPRMSKVPALQNVFLTRQGAKIPPSDCLSGTNVAKLSEALGQEIDSIDPKDPTQVQQLAAFEFEVHFDETKVCVNLTEGSAWTAAGAICIIEDKDSSQLEGIARIGCVTTGKGHEIDETQPLASIQVRPQPEIYSQAKPNQENGVVVQINNVNCDLGDEQGHAIPIFSCDDADITFRYLEGDVEPDCVVDAADAQAIAFRWGVSKGSSIYRDFMNLEPSGAQADDDIDINDLQFVFGRFGSTCLDPHPPQEPVNPKA